MGAEHWDSKSQQRGKRFFFPSVYLALVKFPAEGNSFAVVHQHGRCEVSRLPATEFSRDVTSVILLSQNNKTAAMLVSQTNPVGKKTSFFPDKFA